MYLTLSALIHGHKSSKSDAVSCVCSSGSVCKRDALCVFEGGSLVC